MHCVCERQSGVYYNQWMNRIYCQNSGLYDQTTRTTWANYQYCYKSCNLCRINCSTSILQPSSLPRYHSAPGECIMKKTYCTLWLFHRLGRYILCWQVGSLLARSSWGYPHTEGASPCQTPRTWASEHRQIWGRRASLRRRKVWWRYMRYRVMFVCSYLHHIYFKPGYIMHNGQSDAYANEVISPVSFFA